MNTIQCADCGAERQARNKNTKYCRVCRLLRNFQYLRKRGQGATCFMCDASFAPLYTGDDVCADCDRQADAIPLMTCAFCGGHRKPIDTDVAVCLHCAKDPGKRDVLIRSLAKKVRARTEDNA